MTNGEGAFLSRWARRKAQAKSGPVPAEPLPPVSSGTAAPALSPQPAQAGNKELDSPVADPPNLPPPLTLDDVASLTPASDYSRFVAPGVDAGVSNAAMKKLFADPHFNVMDRLDVYIDDYSLPDPIPKSMLRQMVQATFLDLFADENEEEKKKLASAAAPARTELNAPAAPDNPTPDENTDLQLQPDHASGRPGLDEGAGPRES